MARILIVEDESIVAKDIKSRLHKLGYTVSAVASSGEEAIEKAQDNTDLVLMDIVLKGKMDGIEAAEIIRTFGIPVIYVTSHAEKKTLERAEVTEPYGYILKPFEDRELYTAIEMALYKHKMEKKLKESEQWLATTLRSIGDGVITTDTEGVVTFMNPAAESLTGWTQKEAVGKSLSDVFYTVDEETRERCENPWEKIQDPEDVVGVTCTAALVARDSTERLIAETWAPICDGDSIFGTVLVFRDITEKQRMEQEMLRVQKLESISILAGGIAHDCNNILTAILGSATLARMYSTQDRVTEKLTRIEKASLQAKDLTQQLLTFSKGGAPAKRITHIAELIKDSVRLALRGSNVRCHFYLPEELWPVNIDTGQISQVINNIIINADQAMPEGGIIQVRGENVHIKKNLLPLKEGIYLKISITDEGIGIPPEHLQRIFDPYFTTKQKGSGLGLSVCYSVVRNHDGHITVESKLGVRTTFSVYLPASRKEILEKDEKTEPLVEGVGRVLLMDDEEIIRNTAGEILQHLGYTVVTARDGREAVDIYVKALENHQPFDVVIMDLTIPGGMGGKETIHHLLEIDPDVKAIVSSGYSDNPVTAHYREYGFSGVVTKPYTVRELSRVVSKIVKEG